MGYSPESAESLNGAAWSLTALALIIVAVRVYARAYLARAFGADDTVIIVAVLISTAYSGMLSAATAHGTGTPLSQIPPEKIDISIEYNIIAGVFGIIAFSVPKLSVGLLLARVLNPKPLTKFLLIAAPTFAILWSCSLVIITFTQCNPSEGIWTPEIKPECISPNVLTVMGIFAGSFSALLDIAFAVYPAVIVLGLQMSIKKKIGFCAVFSLGLLAAAATIVKCVQVPGLANHSNVTQSDVELLIWTSVETNIIIIAASIPTLGPLIKSNKSASKTPKRSSYKEFSGQGENYSYQLRETGNKSGARSAAALRGELEDDQDYEIQQNVLDKYNSADDGNITKTVEVYTTTVQQPHKVKPISPTFDHDDDDADGAMGQGGNLRTWYDIPDRQPRRMT